MKDSGSTVFRLATICLSSFPASVAAHHSRGPHFDLATEVAFENAVVAEFGMVNPHAYVYFDVTDDSGEVANWRCEMNSATLLRRAGWTEESLLPGQAINVRGAPARREDNHCVIGSLTSADGREVGSLGPDFRNQGTISTEDRPDRLGNGLPNMGGHWVSLSFGPGAKGGEALPPQQGSPMWGGYELTEAGLALAEAYDVRYDDPNLACHPGNIIAGWNHGIQVNRVDQTDDRIDLQYGHVDFVRTIYLDIDEHPANLEPSVGGHSIGRWEDDVLVVDTAGFEPGVLLTQGGVPHSEDLHIEERFHLDTQNNELVRNYKITDPDNFVGVHEGVDYMAMSATPYTPYDCVELSGRNNLRPE